MSATFIIDCSLAMTWLFADDTESPSRAWTHVLPLCRAYQLTSYDAMYLELAQRRRLPLATLDEPLRKAAKKAGVKLLGR